MTQKPVQVQNWHIPTDLEPAVFENNIPDIKNVSPNDTKIALPRDEDNTPFRKETIKPSMSERDSILNNGMIDKLLPLIGKISNGGLDMQSMLELLDKSGQGFGALGKLLPIIAPLIQNGGLSNLLNPKKKSSEDVIEYNSINLDN